MYLSKRLLIDKNCSKFIQKCIWINPIFSIRHNLFSSRPSSDHPDTYTNTYSSMRIPIDNSKRPQVFGGLGYVSKKNSKKRATKRNRWQRIILKDEDDKGFHGLGEPIPHYIGRRTKWGKEPLFGKPRVDFWNWPTLKKCILNCPSAKLYDRMPDIHELDLYYKDAWRGVKRHGGFDVVAQMLNLAPRRPYLILNQDYPTWIEEFQLKKKAKEIYENPKITKNIFSEAVPNYIRNIQSPFDGDNNRHNKDAYSNYIKNVTPTKNIQGLVLSKRDRNRLVQAIYKKINSKLLEQDLNIMEAVDESFENKQHEIEQKKIKESMENGFYVNLVPNPDLYKVDDDMWWKHGTVTGTHILLQDDSHVEIGEKKQKKGTFGRVLDGSLEMLKKRLGLAGKKKKKKAE